MHVDNSVEPHALVEGALDSLRAFCESAQTAQNALRASQPDLGTLLQDTAHLALPALAALRASKALLIQRNQLSRRLGSLPHDVLAEIFRIWALIPDGPGRNHRNRAIPAPYAAASVNRHWREVALATPSIWTWIVLNFETTGGLLAYVDTNLSRSGACSLRVDMFHAQNARRYSIGDSHLISLLSRCQRLSVALDITKDDGDFSSSVLQALQMSMPVLEHLELSGVHLSSIVPDHTTLLTLCPRLKTLKMERLRFSLIHPAMLPRLEHFASRAQLRGADIEVLVKACPLLTRLEISSLVAVVPLTLPKVSTLECSGAPEIFRGIASATNVPALRHLVIGTHPNMVERFTEFLESGPCASLVSLEVAHPDCVAIYPDRPQQEDADEPWKLLELTPKLPNLSVLRLRGFCDAQLSTFLDSWQKQIRLAPKLRRLELHDCSMYGATSQLLMGFLAARKEANLPLEDVDIAQRGEQQWTWTIFSPWMQWRLGQLVTGAVSVDIGTAIIPSYDFA